MALCELPRTNPTLYDKISANHSIGEESNKVEEDTFSPENEIHGSDATDIPTEVVRSLVVSNGRNIGDGYGLDNNGTIVRVGAAKGTLIRVRLSLGGVIARRLVQKGTEVNGGGISN